MRLLLVEDDEPIAEALAYALRSAGYALDLAVDGDAADNALHTTPYDLVLLDLGLPRLDGFDLLRRLRSRGLAVPVIVVTARDEVSQRVLGLDLGADDYVLKPFDLDELLARVRAALRRAAGGGGDEMHLAALSYQTDKRLFKVDGGILELSRRESDVLEVLMLKRGRVVSKAQIQEHLCDWSDELSDSAIEIHIHRVRKKLEGAGVEIRTVRGFGYLLRLKNAST